MSEAIIKKILELKQKRKAVILVHNYQLPEIQDIADFTGDSLGLSQKASQTDAEVIVFCGVHFMAETASIICPDKTVLLPDKTAGCPMADMITAEKTRQIRKQYPTAAIVAYVNTTAEVKAEADICCTSANAVKVVSSISAKKVVFIPDKYLGHYVSSKVVDKEIIFYEGYCPIHVCILPEHIKKMKKEHSAAEVVVHPECLPEVINLADKVYSTSDMIKYAQESKAKEMIIGTEVGILYRLKKDNPDKIFYSACEGAICPDMKKITLEKVLCALEELKYEVKVPKEIQIKAKQAVDNMLAIGRQE